MHSLLWFECKSPGRLTGRPIFPPPLRELLEASIPGAVFSIFNSVTFQTLGSLHLQPLGFPVPRVDFQIRFILS